MKPIDLIREAYSSRPEAKDFDWYLQWHLEHGFVFSTPEFFIMGFAVDRAKLAGGAMPMDCYATAGDCWYLFAMAGAMEKAWSIMPWKLHHLAWHRDRAGGKDLHIVPLEQIRRLSGG